MGRINKNIFHSFRSHKRPYSPRKHPPRAQHRILRQQCLSPAKPTRRLSGRQEQNHGDIHLLEERIRHLDPPDAQNLQADIFDHLARRYYDNETYQKYLKALRYEEDPMESGNIPGISGGSPMVQTRTPQTCSSYTFSAHMKLNKKSVNK